MSPHIGFSGLAREAMEFYQSVFGGELDIRSYGDFGRSGPHERLVMHAHLTTPQGYDLMAADAPPEVQVPSQTNLTITLSGDDPELAELWAKLSDGGTVNMPFETQMWGDTCGDCVDRFGVRWAVDLGEPGTAG